VKFSRRAQWNAPTNRLTIARQSRCDLLDLTNSNPTRAGIDYPTEELSEILSRAARATYDPQPLGLRSAREAVAEHTGCDADDVVITASTSEAYSFLFKLLTDPGDSIATATPSYPLLEHLAQLELITLKTFPMEFHRRWEIDGSRVPRDVRAVIVVNPNNPTGSFVTPEEFVSLPAPIISDEVFIDYRLDVGRALARLGPAEGRPTFRLGGLSKSCGLPHYKLGWIITKDRDAINALELIADNFLSVSTPVQVALPELLRLKIREQIQTRIEASFTVLKDALATKPHAQLLPVEGGWSAVIRIPETMTDEEFALQAIEQHGVVVHPGYFFDFDREGYFVVSLLTEPEKLAEGITRIV
jgi:aspartate/methionine/tyrosine aminotransferase